MNDPKNVTNVAFLAPSITPRVTSGTGTNPGVRLYQYEIGQSYLQNYEQFYTRLSNDNSMKKIQWERLYDFRNTYNVPDLSTKSLFQVYKTIWTNDELGWLMYLKIYKFNTLLKFNGNI